MFLLAVDLIGQEATLGTDVSGSSFQVRFRNGQTQAFLQLRVVDDIILESTETFLVRLLSPISGIIQEPDEAIVTIFDDECKMIYFITFLLHSGFYRLYLLIFDDDDDDDNDNNDDNGDDDEYLLLY